MTKWLVVVASVLTAGCTANVVTSSTGGVGRAEMRQLPAVAALRMTKVDPVAAAIEFVHAQRPMLGVNAHTAFTMLRATVGGDGQNHIRLQQTYDGVKVSGADIVVHTTDAAITGVDGKVLVSLEALDLAPSLADDTAMSIAKSNVSRTLPAGATLASKRETNELVILPDDDGKARLTWHVTFFTPGQPGAKTALWNYFIDAHDGAVVDSWNGIDTVVVEASGPGGNARVSRTWSMDLDVDQSGSTYTMNTTQFETQDSRTNNDYSGTSLTNFNANDKGANDAQGYAEVTIHMLKDWFGYNSIDGNGYKLISIVHVPDPMTGQQNLDNAYWDGQQMNYGDGDGTTFFEFTGALDVIAHEMDHGFTQFHSGLGYSGQTGGMNESFSDIAGTTAKFYLDPKTADFNLGGDIYKQAGKYIRWMCTPSMDGKSIDNASQYKGSLDVHYTSGVMNRAFCRAAKRLSGADPDTGSATPDGVKKAAKAWYEANASHWTSSTVWKSGCQGVIDAATALKYAAGDISGLGDSWKDVGVTCTYTHVNDFGLTLTPTTAMAMAGTMATFQVMTTVPAGGTAQSLTLSISGLPAGVTGTFAPATLMSGTASTLTIAVPGSAMLGDTTFTVTATGTTTRTAQGTLTVTAPPPDMATPPDMTQPPDLSLPPDLATRGGGGNGGSGGGGNGGSGGGVGGNGANGGNGAGGGKGCSCDVSGRSSSSGGALLFLMAFALLVRHRSARHRTAMRRRDS